MPSLHSAVISFALVLSFSVVGAGYAQPPSGKKPPPIPKPRPVELKTKDGVELSGFYFGSNKGKDAIPVILIHGWQGEKAPYGKLCLTLQKAGCAVLAFDYRGHGRSRQVTLANGQKEDINLQTMRKADIMRIVQFDIEEAKRFLIKENNEEKLNLNALVLVSVREGSVLAAAWAQADWRFPNVGTRKQGHDVKALVMVSPKRLLKGLRIEQAVGDPNIARLPMLLIAGRGTSESGDADSIEKRVGALKRRFNGGRDPEGLTLLKVKESLGGPALVNDSAEVIPAIVGFIQEEVKISDVDNPWIKRE